MTAEKQNHLLKKLHERSDKKLYAFIEGRLGDLGELCNLNTRDFGSEKEAMEDDRFLSTLNRMGVTDPDIFPWHPMVWELASAVLFWKLRDSWREREVKDFMDKVERLSAGLVEIDCETPQEW